MPYCASCGASLMDDSSFCFNCGKQAQTAGVTVDGDSGLKIEDSGISDDLAGMLAYFLIPAVLFLVLDTYKKSRFIRFHAFQCLYFVAAWFVFDIATGILGTVVDAIPFIGHLSLLIFLTSHLVNLACTVVEIYLMVRAYQGKQVRLPVIGAMAAKHANAIQ